MAELPNLAGIATKDLVESIGTGKFSASYINWSRTMNLLHKHAPGWMVDYQATTEGELLHRAPVGAYLLISFRHIDGTATPALPQAVMDHRNNAIPYDKITARDISDTQRRGMCMAAAMTFGLGYELWAKMPLENGYSASESASESAPESAPKAAQAAPKAAPVAATGGTSEPTEATFREAALDKGFTTYAIDGLLGVIKGNYASGIATVAKKTAAEVEALNAKYAPKEAADDGEQW